MAPGLRIGITSTDRTRAILDGRLTLVGYDLDLVVDEPQALFRAGQIGQTLDVAEMSLGTHLLQTDNGTANYWALPVFLSRAFRHGSIYVRSDRGIDRPSDLNGRRIGIAGFQQTATIWVRGILADHYGFDPASVQWIVGGLVDPVSLERAPIGHALSRQLEPAPTGRSLDEMLAGGEIDALISPAPPPCAQGDDVPVRPLFDDIGAQERQYYAKTGIFPPMHVLGISKALAEQHADLPAALFRLFAEAKAMAQAELAKGNYLRVSLPWVAEEAKRTRALMGENPWSYGLKDNATGIETLIRYAVDDALVRPGLGVDQLFHPATLALADITEP